MSDEEKENGFGLTDREDEEEEGQQVVELLANVASGFGLLVTDIVESLKQALAAGMNRNNKDD